jgi:hypothetical protein
MDSKVNEKKNSYDSILGDLDKKIVNYKETLNYYPNKDNSKILKFDKLKDNILDENKSFYDLISKYQLDNSNLKYENFYLKRQNKYLEEELQNMNEKYLSLKNQFDKFNEKLNEIEKIKKDNLINLNEKFNKALNEIREEKNMNIQKDEKNILFSIEKIINNKINQIQNLGFEIDLKKKFNITTLEIILNKLIEQNQKLNQKIEEQNKIINKFNSNKTIKTLQNEKQKPKYKKELNININKLKEETFYPTLSLTKENTLTSDRFSHKNIMKKINNEIIKNTLNLKPNNPKYQNNINQRSPNHIKNKINNNIENNLSPYSNFSSNNLLTTNNNPSTSREEIKISKEVIFNNNQSITNPLYGLKSKIEILENMLKDANVSTSQNDINLDSNSYYYTNSNPLRNFSPESDF